MLLVKHLTHNSELITQNSELITQHLTPVIPAGFEPATHSLEGCCSIQLSYETG